MREGNTLTSRLPWLDTPAHIMARKQLQTEQETAVGRLPNNITNPNGVALPSSAFKPVPTKIKLENILRRHKLKLPTL